MVASPPGLLCTSLSLSIESSISGLQRRLLDAWKSSLPLSDACLECAPPSCHVVSFIWTLSLGLS